MCTLTTSGAWRQALTLISGRPKQFLERNTKTENDTSEKLSFGRNQLIDQTISVLAKTVSFGRNSLFWPKQSLLAKIIFDLVVLGKINMGIAWLF